MVDKTESAEREESAADLRNKLIKRLVVAGVLVAILLGILAFFDYLATPPEEADGPVFTEPVPVAPKKTLSQPVTPVAEPDETPPAPAAPAADEAPPPPPQPAAQPASPAAVVAPVATPGESKAPEKRPPEHQPARTVEAVPRVLRPLPSHAASAPLPVEEKPAPVAAPTARVVESRPAPPPPSGVARLFSGFLLQAGVFSSPQRAEELHAKLTLSGVPSTLETRVQVGPFRTRQEAEAAQAKLRELGVDSVLVPPRTARR